MKIKIIATKGDGTNPEIHQALLTANGKATQHTITKSTEIIELANTYEAKLYRMVGKNKDMKGAVVTHRSGSQLPKSYKNSRIVTYIEMTRGSDCWWLTNVQTDTAWNEAGKTILKLTETQDAAAIANIRNQYQIITK